MSFIALVRMQGGSLVALTEGDDKLAEWQTEEQAIKETDEHILAPLGIEIVEVNV